MTGSDATQDHGAAQDHDGATHHDDDRIGRARVTESPELIAYY
ncbi:hypothetical protein [Streptomyces sp. CBMA156]|nr:hypothetical protein [Streptomyces sp. CBMA156]